MLNRHSRSPLSDEERTRRAVALTVNESGKPRPPFEREAEGAKHQHETAERATAVDPERKPPEANLQAEDGAGGSSEADPAGRGGAPATSLFRTPGDTDKAGRAGEAGGNPAPDDSADRLPALIWRGEPIDRWVSSSHGLRRWRPIIDRIDVHDVGDGARLIEFSGARPLRLEKKLAEHLALLLMPEEWRQILANAGVKVK